MIQIHYMQAISERSMQMAEERTPNTVFNSDPGSKLYEYKIGLDRIQSELIKFGLTTTQAKVFIYLGKYGSKTSPEVCRALKLPRTETYHILNVLMNRGIITSEFSHPTKFSALPIEQAILTMVNAAQEKVNKLAKKENELAKLWNEIPFFMVETNEPKPEKFQMLQGPTRIYSKMKEMISNSSEECVLLCNTKDLSRFYYSNLVEQFSILPKEMKLLISPDPVIPHFTNKMKKTKIRTLPKNRSSNQCFLVKDDNEVIIFLRNANYSTKNVFAFWTDSKSLIESMKLLFDYSWKHSKSITSEKISISNSGIKKEGLKTI